jgi:hypothetical protein
MQRLAEACGRCERQLRSLREAVLVRAPSSWLAQQGGRRLTAAVDPVVAPKGVEDVDASCLHEVSANGSRNTSRSILISVRTAA